MNVQTVISSPGRVILGHMIPTFLLLLFTWDLQAQSSLMNSLRGLDDLGGPQPANYNLKLGPMDWSFGMGQELIFTDNATFIGGGAKEKDLISRTGVNAQTHWQITEYNRLQTQIGFGYQKSFADSSRDQFFVSMQNGQASQIDFDIWVSPFKINVHEIFNITQNPISENSLVGNGDFGVLNNIVGVGFVTGIRLVGISFGYDRMYSKNLNSTFTTQDNNQDMTYLRLGYQLNERVVLGVGATFGLIHFSENFRNDARQFTVGPYLTYRLTEHTSFRLRVGLNGFQSSTSGLIADKSSVQTYFFGGEVSNQLNERIRQSLSFNRGVDSGLGSTFVNLATPIRLAQESNFIKQFQINYTVQLNVFDRTQLNLGGFFAHGSESNAAGESFNRYGIQMNTGFALTSHSTLGLGFAHQQRSANIAGRDFGENRLTTQFNYRF